MRLEQLEYLVGVVRHGSLRRAGEELHVSQPALSEAVAKLERELGVTLLYRHRAGARISREGRELLDAVTDVLEAADRLRAAAGDQRRGGGTVRVGTVNTGTSTLVAPAVLDFQGRHPTTIVELLDLRRAEIEAGLADGSLDLGLVNRTTDDEEPHHLRVTVLLTGRPVVVLPTTHPLTARTSIDVESLRAEPFVAMREGYLMHRFARTLFGTRPPVTTYTTDGAAMGKQMVAEGLGLALLPDFSVAGDPLYRAGLITTRPVEADATEVSMVLLQPERPPREAVQRLVDAMLRRAGEVSAGPALPAAPGSTKVAP